jgi:nucleoid DNA-binding protein
MPPTRLKSDLDREIAMETGQSPQDVAWVTYLLMQKISDALARGEAVSLREFGRFSISRHRCGNPMQAESPSLTHGYQVHFSKSRWVFGKKIRQAQETRDGKASSGRRRKSGTT